MADQNINYISLTETCINVNEPGHSSQIKTAFTHVVPTGNICLHNTPNFPKTSNYQQGGVAACFDGLLRTKFIREGGDKYGRWIWHEFGDSDHITIIYTVYRVCDGSENSSGYRTAWFQQRLQLQKDGIEPNPRTHIMDTLISEVTKHVSDGHNVIVLGDFNEGISSPEKMSEKFYNAGLFNLMSDPLSRTSSSQIQHSKTYKKIFENTRKGSVFP